ncbi:SDR family oxidoreductase [Lentilactobacillus kosonis]|uniref:NAD-dependent epimerase/dehydratase n=1 Tax=Lentilactobacillus kosonis TaxID=2810561 RepID=A0A401FNN4_9LACO|nr:SDR family oxidoreductase [Lentilactobacillus kosonis]GAY73999.1 NAD-dependent epimerase/dehydratase [Lentilactobacillus kosonis]
MKIFVTGATGFIGSTVVDELLRRNHSVIGLARSDRSAQKLTDKGVEVLRGTLEDTEVLAEGSKNSDGVIHLGFTNNFDDMAGAVEQDVNAVNALGEALAGTNKPFVNTSGTLMVAYQGRPATEDDAGNDKELRTRSEKAALGFVAKGVRVTAVRLAPTVHDASRQGLATVAAQIAIKNGAAAYFNGGTNEWPAVHQLDAANLFVDALEAGTAGSVYNAVAESGIQFKDIATTISTTLDLPLKSLTADDAVEYAGPFLSNTLQLNNPTSSDKTQRELNWHPTHPGLLVDLKSFLSNPDNVEYLKNN